MNKKFLTLLLVAALMMTVFTGCKQQPKKSDSDPVNKESVAKDEDTQKSEVEKVEAVGCKEGICFSTMG